MRLEELRDNSTSNCPKGYQNILYNIFQVKKRKERNDKNYTNMPRLNFFKYFYHTKQVKQMVSIMLYVHWGDTWYHPDVHA